MSREESAARALGEFWDKTDDANDWPVTDEQETAVVLRAADAHDAANGVHRLVIDDATVERAARALHDRTRSQAACSCCFTAWEDAGERTHESYRDDARLVLAAAVKEGGE